MAHVLNIGGCGRAKKRAGRARADARARSIEPHASLYDEVTERIVAELEAGRFPWVQPWDSAVVVTDWIAVHKLDLARLT